MMRIGEIALREIRLPLKEPFRISSGVVSTRRILLAELRSSDGLRVWAENVAFERPNYSAETIETAWYALRDLVIPRVLDATLEHPKQVTELLDRDFRGHRMAKATVEMGVWALFAERQGISLARLLGGVQQRIAVGVSLGIQATPAELVARASAAAREGYHKIKLKIEPGADISYIAAVREALPAAPLMVDANNAYSLADTEHLAQLDEFDLMMVEQPLEHEDLVRHATLQKRMRTRICLDESITSVHRAADMIALGAGRIINIKPGRVGGFATSLAIHDLAVQNDVPLWCGGMLETGIGRAYNVALASLPGFTIPGDLSPSARYWQRDVVTPEWTMDADGMVDVPFDRPGLGVMVDEDFIDDLTVRREAFVAR